MFTFFFFFFGIWGKKKIKPYTGLNFIALQSGMQVPVNIMRWRHLKSGVKKVQAELIL